MKGGRTVDTYDVIIVGARCAGSPLATLLAREGLSVAVVDRASFPSDTVSTHLFQNEGVKVLAALGVLDGALASGAPFIERGEMRVDGFRVSHPLPRRADDPGAWLCVRRPILDTLLVEAAQEAGADLRAPCQVTGLVHHDGRVSGVTISSGDGADQVLEASLVVGADGRASSVARHAGARSYNLIPNQRFGCWAYFEGVDDPDPPAVYFQRWDEEMVLAGPADSGLHLVGTLPPRERLAAFRAAPEACFDDHVARCEPVSDLVSGARRVGELHTMARWTGYFRDAAGPGWVLVGDAGHFKDPTPGQGIADALRQAEKLAPEIVSGLGRGTRALDAAMARWGRWRDEDAAEMAWFAGDLGRAGRVPPVLVDILTELAAQGRFDEFLNVFNHRAPPSEVLTPPRLMAATSRVLARGEHPRRQVLRQTKDMIAEDVRRKRLNKHPDYAAVGSGHA